MLAEIENESLVSSLFDAFVEWYDSSSELNTLHTTDGDTQDTERDVIAVFEETLKEFGYCYKKASSQQPYDFRICLDKDVTDTEDEKFKSARTSVNSKDYHLVDLINDLLLVELKKTQTGNVILNDTIPQPDSFYVIVNLKKQEIGLWKGRDIIVALENKMRDKGAVSWDIYQYQKDVKELKEKYGKAFTPRMNLSFSYSKLRNAVKKFSLK